MISAQVRCVNCDQRFQPAPGTCPVCTRTDRWEGVVVDDAPEGVDAIYMHHTGVAFFSYDEAAKAGAAIPVWATPAIPANTASNRAAQLETRLAQAITANSSFLAIASPTNAQNAAQVKALTRQVQALLRKAQGRFDGVD